MMIRKAIITCFLVILCSPLYSKRLVKSISFADQIKEEYGIYKIYDSFDLQGSTVTIPKGCKLIFKCGGFLCNGTIQGERATIRLRKKCLSKVNVLGGIKSCNRLVKASIYREWDGNSLASLCSLCQNGGQVDLDANYDYTQGRTLKPNGSIVIDGRGKTVRTINPTSEGFCPTFLSAKGIKRMELRNLIVDGGWKNKALLGGTDPNRWFIITDKVDSIVIENCQFKDIKVSFSNWREVEDAMMLFKDFHFADFKKNEIVGCKAPEGLLFRHEPDESGDVVLLDDNKFDFIKVSSNVNVYFCIFKITNNYFGYCRGSGINAFGHDSQIIGNVIEGSYNSAGIDISEYGEMNYPSRNIEIRNNKSGLCYGGFFAGYDVSGVSIVNNHYDANQYDADAFASYNTSDDKRTPTNDRMLYLGGALSDIFIKNNTFQGGNSLVYQWDDVQRKNVVIDNNIITVVEKPVRSVIALSSVDGMTISNNKFSGTGMTLRSLGYPSFICSQPLPEGSENRYANVEIYGNEFIIPSTVDSCYVFAHTIYDKRKFHGLAKMGSISIHNNKCNKPANVLINTGDFTYSSTFIVEVKNNDFNGGKVIGNVPHLLKEAIQSNNVKSLKRNSRIPHGTVLREGDNYFYVISGGITSKSSRSIIEKDGLIYDGDAVLQKLKKQD